MRELIAVGVGGFAGAIGRYLISGWVQRLTGSSFPWGTLAVNVVGCLALGMLMRFVELRGFFGPEARLFVGVGILGSLTTFSTFGYETVELMRRWEPALALGNVAVNVLVGGVAVLAGRLLAGWIAG